MTEPAGRSGPPAPSVAVFLVNLGRRSQAAIDQALAEHGLAFHHVAALGHLDRQPGLSYSELARRSGVAVASMQQTVARLRADQLVESGPDAGQGRRADLTLTARGRKLLAASEAAIRAIDDQALAVLGSQQRSDLEAALLQLFKSSFGRSADPR